MQKYTIKKKIYSSINKILNFKNYLKLKKIKNIILNEKNDEIINKETGFKFLEKISINPQLAEELKNYLNQRKKEFLELEKYSEKKFLINMLDNQDINKLKHLVEFSLSKEIIHLATKYLDEVPFLSCIRISITKPNNTAESSQLYHLDTESEKNVKFFFLLSDVDENNGPFTFLDKINSKKVVQRTKYDGKRLEEDKIFNYEKNYKNLENKFTGKYGDGLAIDTANCLHYGSRNNKKERIILILSFTTHFTSHYQNYDLYKKIDQSTLNSTQKYIVSHFKKEIFTDKNFLKFS